MNNLIDSYFENDKYIDVISDTFKTDETKKFMKDHMTELLPFIMNIGGEEKSETTELSDEDKIIYDFYNSTLNTIKTFDRKQVLNVMSKFFKSDVNLSMFMLLTLNYINNDDDDKSEIEESVETDSIDLELEEEYKLMKQS